MFQDADQHLGECVSANFLITTVWDSSTKNLQGIFLTIKYCICIYYSTK